MVIIPAVAPTVVIIAHRLVRITLPIIIRPDIPGVRPGTLITPGSRKTGRSTPAGMLIVRVIDRIMEYLPAARTMAARVDLPA